VAQSKQNKLFAELGLLEEQQAPEPNPLEVLGADREFARNLLRDDPTGDALRLVTAGLYRALGRVYHPDVPETGSSDRFRGISSAHERIVGASGDKLLRWAKTERTTSSANTAAAREQRETIAAYAGKLVRENILLGQHPQHFAQFGWSQGVLLQRGASTVLLRQRDEGGLRINKGREMFDATGQRLDDNLPGAHFHNFLRKRDSFGLEPGVPVVAYMDGEGRASLLTPGLRFLMDITGPVGKLRTGRQAADGPGGYWARTQDPLVLNTKVPAEGELLDPEVQIRLFPEETGSGRSRLLSTWNLRMEVAGSVTNPDVYKQKRHNRVIGAAALEGSTRHTHANYFGMAGLPVEQLITPNFGYTPLVAPGNSLVLYDPSSEMPIVTDAMVVGMIGNGAYFSE
jgi:hypothetical protein